MPGRWPTLTQKVLYKKAKAFRLSALIVITKGEKMDYTMAQAKREFGAGYLKLAELERLAMGAGWAVKLGSYVQGLARMGYLVDARSHQVREFKTVDAAVRAVEGVGFKVSQLLVEA